MTGLTSLASAEIAARQIIDTAVPHLPSDMVRDVQSDLRCETVFAATGNGFTVARNSAARIDLA